MNVITKGDDVKGYYMFYKSTKSSQGESPYRLVLLNKNAEVSKELAVGEGKSLYLLEAQYNKSLFCFKLYDSEQKKVMFFFYDEEGVPMGQKFYSADLYASQLIALALKNDVRIDPSLYPVHEVGFLNYRWVKNDKPGYEIRFYANDMKKNSWMYKSSITSKNHEFATLLYADKNIIVNSVTLKSSKNSKDTEYQISVLNTLTGRELFRHTVKKDEYISKAYYNEDKKELTLLGSYFMEGEDVFMGQSLGICRHIFDTKGKLKQSDYYGKENLQSILSSESDTNTLKNLGLLAFTEINKNKAGELYAFGESLNVQEISNNTNVRMANVFYLRFNEKDELKHLGITGNISSSFNVSSSLSLNGVAYTITYLQFSSALVIDYIEGENSRRKNSVYYSLLEKAKSEKSTAVYGRLQTTEPDITDNRYNRKSGADDIKLLPSADDGAALLVEYLKKEGKIEINKVSLK